MPGMRFLCVLAFIIVGTSAEIDACVADPNGVQQCHAIASLGDVASLMQLRRVEKMERGQDEFVTTKASETSGGKEPGAVSGAVGLCSPVVVQQACGEIAGAANRSAVYPQELADALSTDAASGEAFLTSLGLDFSTKTGVSCDELCSRVLEAIPEAQRPPSSDVAAQEGESGLSWDIDLSPEALNLVDIPELPPDNGTVDMDADNSTASLLQDQGGDQGSAGTTAGDMPEKYTPEPMDVAEMSFEAAQIFRMYPALAPPASGPKTASSLAAVSSLSDLISLPGCGREAIWDKGEEYVGCQTKARSGKTCIKWSDGPSWTGQPSSSWKSSHSNWCRNPDSDKTIWCWTGPSVSEYEFCDPLDKKRQGQSAPGDFAKVAGAAGQIAAAWVAKAISKWDAIHLPDGYETWMGPSEADVIYGRTVAGCACKEKWESHGQTITDYCGNPDNDAGGDWCFLQNKNCLSKGFQAKTKKGCRCGGACQNSDNDSGGQWCKVEDKSCQDSSWGYCMDHQAKEATTTWDYCAKPKTAQGCACLKKWSYKGKTARHCANPDNGSGGQWCFVEDKSCQGKSWGYCKKPCGDSCKNVRQVLEKTRKTVEKIGFEYDGKSTAYAYVQTLGEKFDGSFPVTSIKGMEAKYYFTSNGKSYAVRSKTLKSDYVGKRAIMTMCPAWWKLCSGDIAKCKNTNKKGFGTLVGTIVHETMHHFPIGADDYLYYRKNIKQWVAANRLNKNAMTLVKDCADCLEYLVEDINGYTDTGR